MVSAHPADDECIYSEDVGSIHPSLFLHAPINLQSPSVRSGDSGAWWRVSGLVMVWSEITRSKIISLLLNS